MKSLEKKKKKVATTAMINMTPARYGTGVVPEELYRSYQSHPLALYKYSGVDSLVTGWSGDL